MAWGRTLLSCDTMHACSVRETIQVEVYTSEDDTNRGRRKSHAVPILILPRAEAGIVTAGIGYSDTMREIEQNLIGAYGPWAAQIVGHELGALSLRTGRFKNIEDWRAK